MKVVFYICIYRCGELFKISFSLSEKKCTYFNLLILFIIVKFLFPRVFRVCENIH